MARLLNRAGWIAAAVLALLLVAALAGVVLGGPLDPPGTPGSTGKTLQEVEPRVPIESLPFIITQPGSYYLTGNITCPTCGEGIDIEVGDVTVDLNGFTISGGTGSAVAVYGGRSNVTVKNGSVSNWGAYGISFDGALHSTVSEVNVSGVGLAGVVVNSWDTVKDCVSYGNQNGVYVAGTGNVVSDCSLTGNLAAGMLVSGTSNRITGNDLTGNSGNGLTINGAYNVAEDNSADSNASVGFQVNGAGNRVFRNSASHNTSPNYMISGGNDAGPVGTAAAATSPWANISE